MLVAPKFLLLPAEELFPKTAVGCKAVLPGPANRDSLIQRNFNVSASDKAAAAVGISTGAAPVDVLLLDAILEEENSVVSLDNHGVLYPAISACDMDRYFNESAAL